MINIIKVDLIISIIVGIYFFILVILIILVIFSIHFFLIIYLSIIEKEIKRFIIKMIILWVISSSIQIRH